MKTTQDAFHAMRGHVTEGCEVVMRNGDVLTLTSTMSGWQLVDQGGRRVGAPTPSAHVIECLVYSYPNEDLI